MHRTSPGRLLAGPSPALLDVLPREFAGREDELEELVAFVTRGQDGPDYRWYQAGPWAGKTALLAWFADRYRQLPGIDIAHHFISGRLGTDRREDFTRVVGPQLAAASGMRRLPAAAFKDFSLAYAAAAQACEQRNRRLVLIVDGLDEDTDVDRDGMGIAGLLPKAPPHGMRVIVSGRANPPVPLKLAADHPLRDPGIVRQLTTSSAARAIRDMALVELDELLGDPHIGQQALGLLATARGALTRADLAKILRVRPREVRLRLGTVVSRSLAPTRVDHLALDVRTGTEAEEDRQAFVLAHDVILRTVCQELGESDLAERRDDLHRWAQAYRDQGWPEDTPNYLLTGYVRLLQEASDTERLDALVLDPCFQLRLAERSGADVALAHLRLLVPRHADDALSLDRAAAAPVSREMLLGRVRPVPGAVAQAVARLGDTRRGRALVVASGSAVDKALRLADLAETVLAMDEQEAAVTAREAERWARTALREADRAGYVTDEAEGAAARAALALLTTAGGRDQQEQYADGLALLRSTRGTGSARCETWALAAALLAPDHPQDAARLLDELEQQAEPMGSKGVAVAVQLWQTVAAADPDRADRLHDLALERVTRAWQEAPSLEAVATLAATASFVAPTRPARAGQLAAAARDHLEHVLHADAGERSPADAFHLEFGFPHTLAVLARALTDVGAPPEEATRILELGQLAVPLEPAHDPEEDPAEDDAFTEATALAEQAVHLAGRGDVDDAEHHLQQALALLPPAGRGGRGPVWLPDLAGALVRTGAAVDPEELPGLARLPDERVRVHAAMALAHADCDRQAEARHHAREAARGAAGRGWVYVAQALACVGEVAAAVDHVEGHRKPQSSGGRAAWRMADRAARAAVAAELASHDPEAAYELIRPELERLHASRNAIRSHGLLPSLAELLPAVADLPPHQQPLFHELMAAAREQVARSNPDSWRPEELLVHAFLLIGDGEEPTRQLDRLTQNMAHRGAEHSPTAALAVLHAALGDHTAAHRVAMSPAAPHHRAAALSAVAAHLARVPCRPCPVPDPVGSDAFTHTIQYLALHTTRATPAAARPATRALRPALATSGWHHTIPALSRIAPDAIATIGAITEKHLGKRRDAENDWTLS
ncbi:hypothetical protein [Streptomyces sp. NPDC056010]|uniref:hypothetical protein n=1 Tax=Streptomyces sp. NPDC056010 TaxID=3345679 RepID=UPI0035E1DFEC